MHPTLATVLPVLIAMSLYTVSVDCRMHPSVEEVASEYIVSRLFPSHSFLASKLLNVLVKSVEDGYHQQQQQQQQQLYDDEDIDDSSSDSSSSSSSSIDSSSSSSSQEGLSSVEEILSESGLRGSEEEESPSQSLVGVMRKRQDFGRRLHRLQKKSGLGHCIHNCINGRGGMNFIQCKSMCH